MIDDMSRSEIDQDMSSFIHSADSPCQSCPNREVDYCRFYQQELEEDGFGGYFPCSDCEDDFGDELLL